MSGILYNLTDSPIPVSLKYGGSVHHSMLPPRSSTPVPSDDSLTSQVRNCIGQGLLAFVSNVPPVYLEPVDTIPMSGMVGSVVNAYVSYWDPTGYVTAPRITSSPFFVSVPIATATVSISLAAEQMPYSGGVFVSGSVYKNGVSTIPTWDSYWVSHMRNSVEIDRYWLNYRPSSLARSGVVASTFSIPMVLNDSLQLGYTASDNVTGPASADNSGDGVVFSPVSSPAGPSWESGIRIKVQLT